MTRQATPQTEHGSAPPADAALKLWLLGGFRVEVRGQPVPERAWRVRKARSLVKLLALAPGMVLTRERLAAALWPDFPPEDAANNLRRTLHAARQALALALPATGTANAVPFLASAGGAGGTLHLAPGGAGAVWVDAHAFTAALAAARRAADPDAFAAALGQYGGDLLPEDEYEEWAAAPREALRGAYLDGLKEAAALWQARGHEVDAIAALERVTEIEPADEAAHAALMRLHADAGRREQALRQYRLLRDALRREVDAEPGPATRHLYEALLAGRHAAAPAERPAAAGTPSQPAPREAPKARKDNLPHALTSFIGRERAMAEVRALLDRTRLVTLGGPGGTGKTRLALEVGAHLREDASFPDGVWLAELAPLADGRLVPHAVAAALGVEETPHRPALRALLESCRQRRLLLVLDNCEHVLDACDQLVFQLLRECPGVRVLATSRERLGLTGEAVWHVPPLSLPPDLGAPPRTVTAEPDPAQPERLLAYEAIRLFLDRAALARPGFALEAGNAAAVLRLCRRLDGLPLAIELAAALVASLPVAQIATRLAGRHALLDGNRGADPRHQTLRAAIAWSERLLSEPERRLFARLSVFSGGFAFSAVESVSPGEDVLPLLARLVEKSLVVMEPAPPAPAPPAAPDVPEDDGAVERPHEGARYRLLETLRAYARERLHESGEAPHTQTLHAAHYLALAERAAPALRGPHQAAWLARLDRELENLRAALDWRLEQARAAGAIDEGTAHAEAGMRLAAALVRYWEMRSLRREGRERLERFLALPAAQPPTVLRARALTGAHVLAHQLGDFDAAISLAEESLALSRALHDAPGVARTLYHLGVVACLRNALEEARPHLEESIARLRQLDDRHYLAWALHFLGSVALGQRSLPEAAALLEESIALRRHDGDERGTAIALCSLTLVHAERGDDESAQRTLEDFLPRLARLDDRWFMAMGLVSAAGVASGRGDLHRAARLGGAALGLADAIQVALPPYVLSLLERALAPCLATLGVDEVERLQAEGCALAAASTADAVALALALTEERVVTRW